MKFLKQFMDKLHPHFDKGGKLETCYPLYEAVDTILFTPKTTTQGSVHVRDGLDLKRLMFTVVVALLPCFYMAMYNTGLMANMQLGNNGQIPTGWRADLMLHWFGNQAFTNSVWHNLVHGALYFVPVYVVCMTVGGLWEVLFSVVRKHEINEGFLVTGALFPLTLPPTIPLWQVALGISFGVVFGKEIFGGTGKNFLNPALTARAFLFFAYPAEITGDKIWVAVDGLSQATPLADLAQSGMSALTVSWSDAFWGFMPGSMGETSTFACLLGAVVLVATGIGSFRIMASATLSIIIFSTILNMVGSSSNPMFAVPWSWHLVLGSYAFGIIFMATDPVSGSMTFVGQYFYGALIGLIAIVIRVINPAFPEGTMLAILFANVFAPTIDYFVVKSQIKKREAQAL